MGRRTIGPGLACHAAAIALALGGVARAQQRAFNLPSEEASKAIPEFARQSRLQIIAPADQLKGVQTPAITGRQDARAALRTLLAGTGLIVAADDGAVITLRRAPAEPPAPAAAAPPAREPVAAGTVSSAAGVSGEEVSTVVITGSRLAAVGFATPTPVTVVGAADLQRQGVTNLADELNRLPAFRATTTQTPTTTQMFQIMAGQNFLDLRGLGSQRTLVLVDSRRVTPSALTGAVNLNLIPTIAVQRTEVVTGGASAAYGSDAVAGVVNIILDTRYDGFKAEGQTGISQYGDNADYKVSAAAGRAFGHDRGHAYLAGEYYADSGLGDPSTRPWGRRRVSLITNSGYLANGYPQHILAANVQYAGSAEGGLITSGPLKGTQFLAGGATQPFTYGQVFNDAMIGGQAAPQAGSGIDLRTPDARYALLAHLDYDFNDRLRGIAEFTYADTKSHAQNGYNNLNGDASTGAIVIQADNAYLPAAVKARMATLGLPSFTLGRYSDDQPRNGYGDDNSTYRIVVGLDGDLAGSWRWDAYYQYGHDHTSNYQTYARIPARGVLAADAVTVTAANAGASGLAIGSIACRSTLAAPANGCAPWNLFGPGSTSAAALAYIDGDSLFELDNEQHVAAANLHGELFSTWAGPVAFAAGGEYRSEKAVATADPLSAANMFAAGNLQPINGSLDVKEAYGEVVVPLAKDRVLAKSLELNAAARYTDYSLSGGVDTWKLGVSYQPADDIRIRATRSRDIRAPNIGELFTQPTQVSATFIDRFNGANQPGAASFLVGNKALAPEIADTTTAGVIYQPGWLRGFRASVDYFDININDVIAQPSAQNIVDYCYAGLSYYCTLFARDPVTNTISNLRRPYLNLNQLKTNGFDLDFDYRRPVLGGTASFSALATYVDHLTTVAIQPNGAASVVTDVAGMTSGDNNTGVPHWTWNFTGTYARDAWSATVQARYISGGAFDNAYVGPDNPAYKTTAANSINDNREPDYVLWNIAGQYNLTTKFQLFGAIDNLFDKVPPSDLSLDTTYAFYDVIGRTYRAGLRYGF